MNPNHNQDQLETAVLQLGKGLVARLFVLFKTVQNYQEGHAALSGPVEQLLALIREMHRMNAEASLRMKDDYLYLGDLRLKPDASGFEAFRFTMEEMKRCFLGGICFSQGVQAADITGFLYNLQRIQKKGCEQAFTELQSLLNAGGISRVELEIMTVTERTVVNDEAKMDSRSRARRIYFQAISAVDEIMDSAAKGKSLRLAKAKRVVQVMVDQMRTDPADLVALTTLKCLDNYSAKHPVNVCILSMVVGLRAGLSKGRCCDIGLTALCHDIGKVSISGDIIGKDTDFTSEEWQEIQKHPLYGVSLVLELKQFDALSARMIAGTFEHHQQYDFSGYPRLPYQNAGLFSRIINIADDFDSLTSSRVYRRDAKPADRVIRYMISKSGKNYHPALLKLFISVVGLYPVGTLLLLNSGEVGVVAENRSSAEGLRIPLVKLVVSAAGEAIDGAIMDTTDESMVYGVIDATALGVDTAGYFV
ncbi:MAG: HD domain-containing protein [Geobacteraceae bacterium]|nr:HD domain-containing protein [Geobacteraceae bacterium]